MFESIINFFKNIGKKEQQTVKSKDAAKERLHLVLMQDRANVSADFLDLMKQEIIEVIKKYIDVDENAIDVRLTNKANGDGLAGAPALYANIPIVSIKEEVKNKMARQTNQNEENTQIDDKENEVEQKEEARKENTNEEVNQQEIENRVEDKEEIDNKEKINSEEIKEDKNKEHLEENMQVDNTKKEENVEECRVFEQEETNKQTM